MRSTPTILMAASIAFAAASSTARADDKAPPRPTVVRGETQAMLDGEAQARSDLGQQLQLSLQEANNIYTRSTKAQSDVSAKYNQMLDGIAQNLKRHTGIGGRFRLTATAIVMNTLDGAGLESIRLESGVF